MKLLLFALSSLIYISSSSAKTNNEDDKKALATELLVEKSENKAIEALSKLIQQKKDSNSVEILDLKLRLAELYLRKTKSSRFFEMYEQSGESQLIDKNKTKYKLETQNFYKKSLALYLEIENSNAPYKKEFRDEDVVLFNSALIYTNLNEFDKATKQYAKLIENYKQSKLYNDSLIEIAQIYYQNKNFKRSVEYLKLVNSEQDENIYTVSQYKLAWSYYNLRESALAFKHLVNIINNKNNESSKLNINLKNESVKDLALFLSDSIQTSEILSTLESHKVDSSLVHDIVPQINKINLSHSKYKDVIELSQGYIKKFQYDNYHFTVYSQMIEAQESLKNRDKVIATFKDFYKYCNINSTPDKCLAEFRDQSEKFMSKWWDIWKKNQSNPEFTDLLVNLLKFFNENLVINKNSADELELGITAKFNLAELLYKQSKYEDSYNQYVDVFQTFKSVDFKVNKDLIEVLNNTIYATILSSDEQAKKIKKEDEKWTYLIVKQLDLLKEYYALQQSKKINIPEEQRNELFFKYAQLNEKYKELDQAEKISLELLKVVDYHKYTKLYESTEDLIMLIYNEKKDLKKLNSFLTQVLDKTTNEKRKSDLVVIQNDLIYQLLNDEIKDKNLTDKVSSIKSTIDKAKSKPLIGKLQFLLVQTQLSSEDSQAQLKASQMAIDELKIDANSSDFIKSEYNSILQKSLKVFKAANKTDQFNKTLDLLAKSDTKQAHVYQEVKCQALVDNIKHSSKKDIQTCFENMINTTENDKNKINTYISLYYDIAMQNYKNDESIMQFIKSKANKYSNSLVLYKINLTETEKLYNQNKISEAYNMTLKLTKKEIPNEVRHRARLIQAKILKTEFDNQSLKSSLDKRELVFAIKSEKFEKCLTSLNEVYKYSDDVPLKMEALSLIQQANQKFLDDLNQFNSSYNLSIENQALFSAVNMLRQNLQEQITTNTKILNDYNSNRKPSSSTTQTSKVDSKIQENL